MNDIKNTVELAWLNGCILDVIILLHIEMFQKYLFFLILRNEPEWNFWSMTATESNINTYKHTKESRIQMNLSSRKHKMRYLRICISFKSVLLFILTLLLSSYLFNVFAHQRLLSINDDHTCFVLPNLFRCVTKAEWMYKNDTYQILALKPNTTITTILSA